MVAGWLIVVLAVIASFAVDRAGHGALSWAFDAVAVAGYILVCFTRHRGGLSPGAESAAAHDS